MTDCIKCNPTAKAIRLVISQWVAAGIDVQNGDNQMYQYSVTIPQSVKKTATPANPARNAKDCIEQVLSGLVERSSGKPVTIPPGIARSLIADCNFAGQRRVKQARVSRHLRRINEGSWHPQLSCITFCRIPDGSLRCVNGQHRLHAIAQSGRAVQTRVEIIDVQSDAEVGQMYCAFDEPDSSRSDAEMLEGAQVAESLGLKKSTARDLYRAVGLIRSGLEPASSSSDVGQVARDKDLRLSCLSEWSHEAREYERIVSLADYSVARHLRLAGTMAPMLYMLRHSPKLATEFWEGLARNDGLRRNDPRSRLIADFQSRVLSNGSTRQGQQRVAVAWNAFVEGRDLQSIRCSEGGAIAFKGLPKPKAVTA